MELLAGLGSFFLYFTEAEDKMDLGEQLVELSIEALGALLHYCHAVTARLNLDISTDVYTGISAPQAGDSDEESDDDADPTAEIELGDDSGDEKPKKRARKN